MLNMTFTECQGWHFSNFCRYFQLEYTADTWTYIQENSSSILKPPPCPCFSWRPCDSFQRTQLLVLKKLLLFPVRSDSPGNWYIPLPACLPEVVIHRRRINLNCSWSFWAICGLPFIYFPPIGNCWDQFFWKTYIQLKW